MSATFREDPIVHSAVKSSCARTNMVILSLKKIHDQNKTILELMKQNAKLKNQIAILKQSEQEIMAEISGEYESAGDIAFSQMVLDQISL
jgi:hypothetical protein